MPSPRIPTKVARAGHESTRLTRAVLEFYGTTWWLQLPGCSGRATTTDHVLPVAHGGTDAMENLRPACLSCNSKRRDLAISGIGGITVTVLVGPCAPLLSSRAMELATPGDVVVDLQRIRDALTAPGFAGDTNPHLERTAARVYRTAMDQALRSPGRFRVIIVQPLPTPKQLQQYARLRYTIEVIDPGRELAATTDPSQGRDAARWYTSYPEGIASVERIKAHRPNTALHRHQPPEAAKPSRAW